MARKVADCREHPSVSNCSLTMIGEEEYFKKEATRAA